MSTYQERLLVEKQELDEKLTKLNSFLITDTFTGLSLVNQDLMKRQAFVMKEYSDILQTRAYVKP